MTTRILPAAHPSWCVRHVPDPGGHVCHAPGQAAPADPGCRGGEVTMAHDSDTGPLIYLRCKVEDLTPAEARQLAHALNAQADTAQRAFNCPPWCIATHDGETADDLAHYGESTTLPLSLNHGGQMDVSVDQWDDEEPHVVLVFTHPGDDGRVVYDTDRIMTIPEAKQLVKAVKAQIRIATGVTA